MTPRTKWNRADLLVALNIYHKLTFGQMHARQPLIIEVATKLGRSPNSLAMKLCNFASLDPALQIRGIKGLNGASALDRDLWQQFYGDMTDMAPASEQALRELYGLAEGSEIDVVPKAGVVVRKRTPPQITEVTTTIKARRGQEFFRESVLNNFDGRCGISQLAIRELLVASHILPWATHPAERLNVRNGLCLSRTHDAAFDQGLIAFDDSLALMLSTRLRTCLPDTAIQELFGKHEGKPLFVPEDAALPDLTLVATHRKTIFRSAA